MLVQRWSFTRLFRLALCLQREESTGPLRFMGSRVFLTFEWLCSFICGGRRASQLLLACAKVLGPTKQGAPRAFQITQTPGGATTFLSSDSTLHRPTHFHRRPRQARTSCRRPAASVSYVLHASFWERGWVPLAQGSRTLRPPSSTLWSHPAPR